MDFQAVPAPTPKTPLATTTVIKTNADTNDDAADSDQYQQGHAHEQFLKDFQAMPSEKNKVFLSAIVVFLTAAAVAANPLKSFHLCYSVLIIIVSEFFYKMETLFVRGIGLNPSPPSWLHRI
jgi:hypothetical protein